MNAELNSAIEEARKWLGVKGVQAVAASKQNGRPIVLILASVPEEELRELVPSEVQGFPVVIQGIRPYEPGQPG